VLGGKTVLVTGATGRLGCALCARAEELGAVVLPVVCEGYPLEPKAPWHAQATPIAVQSESDLEALPHPDIAINFHWKVQRDRSVDEQTANERVWNITQLQFLWAWLRRKGVGAFLNCSSAKVYSHLNESPVTAKTEPIPNTPYGIVKRESEKYFDMLFANTATVVTHARLGPVCSFGENESQLVSRLLASALDDTPVTVNSGHTVQLLYVDQAIDLLLSAALAGKPGPCIIAGEPLTNDEVAELCEEVTGRKLNAEYVDLTPETQDTELVPDNASLQVPWVREVPLREGIRRICELRS
jgi:nucleoside-diphosphate-sugar epimerase